MISTAAKVAGSTRIEAALRERGSEDRTVPPERRLELLAGVLAFERLPASVFKELAARLTEEPFQSGDTVVVEGNVDDRLYLIVEGHAEASTTGPRAPGPWRH